MSKLLSYEVRINVSLVATCEFHMMFSFLLWMILSGNWYLGGYAYPLKWVLDGHIHC